MMREKKKMHLSPEDTQRALYQLERLYQAAREADDCPAYSKAYELIAQVRSLGYLNQDDLGTIGPMLATYQIME